MWKSPTIVVNSINKRIAPFEIKRTSLCGLNPTVITVQTRISIKGATRSGYVEQGSEAIFPM